MYICDSFLPSVSTYKDLNFNDFAESVFKCLSSKFSCEVVYHPLSSSWIVLDYGSLDSFTLDSIVSRINAYIKTLKEIKQECNDICICLLANMIFNIFESFEILECFYSDLSRYYEFSFKCSRFPYETSIKQVEFCKIFDRC